MKTLFQGKKLYAVIIIFVSIFIFLVTFYVIHHHYNLVLKDTIKENKSTANLLSSLIYEHQKAATSIMESYTQRPHFIDAVKKKDINNATPHLKSLCEHYSEIDAPFLTDPYGTVWANYPVDSTGFGKNLAHRDWYKGVSKNWKPYISSIYRMIVLGKGLAVAVSVPVFDRNGKVIGILGGAQRTAFMTSFIKANITDTKKSIALLDQEGNIIFSTVVPYAEKITKYPVTQIMEKAVAGITTDTEITDAKVKRRISYVSIMPVRGLGWSIIVEQEKDTILKSLIGYFILTTVTGFVTFLFLIVGLLYFRRQYTYGKTKELQASEEKFRALFKEALDGICLADAETGIIVDCNQALAALVRREREELIGRPQTILHPPQDDKPAVSPTFKQHLTDKQGQLLKTQIVTGTGDIREVEIKANLIDLQGRKLLQGIFRDITERKQVDEALKKSEEKYRNLFDNAVEGVYQSTPEGRLISVNMAFARMFGYESPEEAITLVTDVARQMYANPDDRKRVVSIFRGMGYLKDFECRMRRRDGSTFWANNNGRFTKTLDGTPCFDGFIIDITDRKKAEEEINELNAELEQRVIERTTQLEAANKELEAFSYSVSHDLRAPLRAIDGFSNIIMKEYTDKLDAEGIRLLNVICTNAKHMDQLITDLLAFSQVAKSELNLSRIDMTTLVHSIYQEIVPLEIQQKFAFSVDPLPDSIGDPALLRQVWSNLLANAIKFTLPRDERRIEISGHAEEGVNIYSIKDTGVGFNPKYTHKLFGVFQRLHKSSEFEGNGVGLAIVQRIIHRHGGCLWAEGKINEGAAFFFSLTTKEVKNEPHE